jgi:DNA-binding transcriptional MerR regulator
MHNAYFANSPVTDSPSVPEETHTIGELSEKFHVSLRTLRFYEQIGLLKPDRRGLKRIYDTDDVNRIALILSLRRYDFAVHSIREIASAKDRLPQLEFAKFLRAKLEDRYDQLLSDAEQTRKKAAALKDWIAGVDG